MEENPNGPLQEKVAFGTFVLEVTITGFAVHVIVAPVAEANGGSVFPVTVTEAVPVHPFEELVTVTVKIPGNAAIGFGIFVALKPSGGPQA